ncbi:MAG: competence protein ComEA [Kiritimatiellia bacterium]|jgi:competence protein ComEA
MILLLALLLSAAAAEPIDLNTATVEQLAQLQGFGSVRAAAIVRWRQAHGPFTDLGHIERLPGVGRATVRALSDQVTVEPTASRQTEPMPIDFNTADAEQIATLPAIPQAVAERLVFDRQRHGPFQGCHDLLRVTGVGRATVAAVKDRCQTR